jgi:M6 family metalloprotease-like protein
MRHYRSVLFTAISACLCNLPLRSVAAPASSNPAVYAQPDGSQTPNLFLRGDEHYAWLSDADGYTIMKDSSDWYVYVRKSDGGNLEPLREARVGQVDPKSLGLKPNLLHDYAFDEEDDYDEEELLRLRQRRKLGGKPKAVLCDHEATTVDPCYVKQLALLVRFADHETRNLPSPEDVNVLFNNNGPTGTNVAPTGSIADVYRANSFDTFVLDTHVSDWIQISKTEEYCSGGKQGFNLKETRECWAEALKMYAETLGEDGLSMFDGDSDGYIDGMVIVHSGVAAESNGADCESGAIYNNRIWSHAVPKVPNFEITNEFSLDIGIKTGRFYVFSAVHGNCPEKGVGTKWTPGRIAICAHEGGHFLGLRDLYGKDGVNRGIGNWGFMGEFRT